MFFRKKSDVVKAAERERGYYYDQNHRMRSVETNEIVMLAFYKPYYCLVGVKTKRIYKNFTLDTMNAVNKKLVENGKKYIWKEYSHCNGESLWYPYDPVTNRPFNLAYRTDYRDFTHYIEIVYLGRIGNSGMLSPDPHEKPVRVDPNDVWMWDHAMNFRSSNSFKKPE